ncbi:ribulose bisphosphate carboxylase small subunit [Leptolyngbya ohadii]|uniref:ribulose bisphosphate carboxylase small subunit n=1 Tax=Leptolyngbya ohadii TaxID=1962290 RepID=UPI000B5A10C8|nr:ribulose bisphosphate carboxylase small subunit [Leptolyngbya ohadii]
MSYYLSPRFLDKLAVHITKNFLDLPKVKVPLILGIHGRKGEGKSFQCDLAFERIGVEAVYMSAGELESPDAGDPARLIRLRYREAAEASKVRGRMAVLIINDIDAGMGRVDSSTQYTVNTQLVAGTLMNIADNPTNVQLPGSYDSEPIQRIPIIVTGNDFSTLYAPLVRDGRMEKFYWEPDRADRIGIVSGIFSDDQVSRSTVEQLVDTFPDQSIDFYSALHSRLYDEQVRKFIESVGVERISLRVVNSTEALPEFRPPDFSLPHLIELGRQLEREQQRIQELRLVQQYHASLQQPPSGTGTPTTPNPSFSQSPSGNGSSASYASYSSGNGNHGNHTQNSTGQNSTGQNRASHLTAEAGQQIEELANNGYRIGIEYVDDRRFRTNSWQCYSLTQGNASAAFNDLEACLREHQEDYVRLVGIDPRDRRRVMELVVQRPGSKN